MTRAIQPRPNIRLPLLITFFLPPIVWTLHLLISYGLVAVACQTGSRLPLYLITIAALFITIASGIYAYGLLRRAESEGEEANVRWWERSQFLGLWGVLTSIVFSLPILLWGWAAIFLMPC